MDTLQIAILKDNILKCLANQPDLYIDIEIIKKDIKIKSISLAVLSAYIKVMHDDQVIDGVFIKDGGSARIVDMGQKLLTEGGYTRMAKELEEENQVSRQKTKLEIQNLKLTKWLSIVAIILSIAALIVSIIK